MASSDTTSAELGAPGASCPSRSHGVPFALMGAFKQGRTGTSMMLHQIPQRRCRHQWSPWRRAGIFDSTERRDCARCKRIETRKPRAKPH
jgi:hypothetical protein